MSSGRGRRGRDQWAGARGGRGRQEASNVLPRGGIQVPKGGMVPGSSKKNAVRLVPVKSCTKANYGRFPVVENR